MINQRIHNYRITRKIGSGGMASVYEAIHTKLDTKVAIKVLNPVLATNDGIRKRFEQEAKIMASLNHDGITKVIDFDEEENRLAIVMEYLPGQTLDEYIKQKGALSEKQAKDIFIPVLDAFAYAHKKGIVHRDVKPSNIFITTKGKVKIMDFGIAKIIEDGASVLTQTGTQMGTPVYMSPEQVYDSKHIDKRTDIYSLGVTLWFMFSGKPPYDANTSSAFEIYKKIDSEPLPELCKYPAIDKLIKKATIKKFENRIQSCEEFINTLSVNNNSVNTKDIEKTQIVDVIIKDKKKDIEDKVTTKIDFRKLPDETNLELLYKYPDIKCIYLSGEIIENIRRNNDLLEPIRNLPKLRGINLFGQPLSTKIPLVEYFGTYDELFEHIIKMITKI